MAYVISDECISLSLIHISPAHRFGGDHQRHRERSKPDCGAHYRAREETRAEPSGSLRGSRVCRSQIHEFPAAQRDGFHRPRRFVPRAGGLFIPALRQCGQRFCIPGHSRAVEKPESPPRRRGTDGNHARGALFCVPLGGACLLYTSRCV